MLLPNYLLHFTIVYALEVICIYRICTVEILHTDVLTLIFSRLYVQRHHANSLKLTIVAIEICKCCKSALTPPEKGKAGDMGCDPEMLGIGLHEENHLGLPEILRGTRRGLELPWLVGDLLCSGRKPQLLWWFTQASTPRSVLPIIAR